MEDFIYFQRYTKGSITPLGDLLCLVSNIALKIYLANSRAQKAKSLSKSNKDFLGKLDPLPSLPNAVDFHSNMSHEGGLLARRIALHARNDKTMSTDPLVESAHCVLKNNIFEHILLQTIGGFSINGTKKFRLMQLVTWKINFLKADNPREEANFLDATVKKEITN